MTQQTTPNLIESLLVRKEQMRPLLDAVDGHRAELCQRGYSETAAEMMAVNFHRSLIAIALSGAASCV